MRPTSSTTRCSAPTCSSRRAAATRCASCSRSAASARPAWRTRSPPRRCSSASCRPGSASRSSSATCTRVMDELELPLVAGPAPDGARGRAPEHRPPARDHAARARGDPHARARDLAPRRDRVRHRLAAAARRDPVRQARPVEEAARQDGLLDRRARPAGDPRRARDHPADRALAGAQPARQDVLQRPAAARRLTIADPHDVPAGGGDDGAPGLDEPEHAERPDPHRARARDPRLLRRRAGQRPAQRRLRAGRAARARPHRRRAGPQGDLRARGGRAHGDGVRDLPHAARASSTSASARRRRWSTTGSSTG